MGYLGATAATPAQVLEEMRLTDAIAQTLARDVGAAELSVEFRREWTAFLNAWNRFYKEHGPGLSGWWSRRAPDVYASTQEFLRQAIEWRKRLIAEGGTATPIVTRSGSGVWPLLITGALAFGAAVFLFGGERED